LNRSDWNGRLREFLPGIATLLLALGVTGTHAADKLVEVDTGRTTGVFFRSTAVLRSILTSPAEPTHAALLFFRGWPGISWIETPNDKTRNLLPFMREAEPLLLNAGIALVIVDCPTDQWGPWRRSPVPTSCDDAYRSSAAHVEDVRRLLARLRVDHGLTDFYLLGHSYGTISSKWLAVSLGDEIRGSIHSASMTVPGRGQYHRYGESAARVPLSEIKARVLHLHHRQDACPNTPYAAVHAYAADHLVTVEGGEPTGSDPCGALHYHSYRGAERIAAEAIVRWIREDPITPRAVMTQPLLSDEAVRESAP
jgi:hypothetical protein